MKDHFGKVQEVLRTSSSRWLVDGGAGFIGSHLAERLFGLEQEAVLLDKMDTSHCVNLWAAAWYLGDASALGVEG